MPKSKKIVQRQNLCVSSEKGKSGRLITVSMVDPYIDKQPAEVPFADFARSWNTPPKDIATPTLVDASMCPATFAATGFGFDVMFDVGLVKRQLKHKELNAYGITRLQLGTVSDAKFKTAVDPISVYAPMLLRLALQASAVTAIAYPAGWTVDLVENKYLTTLKVGDALLDNTVTYGVKTKREQRTRRISSKNPDRNGKTITTSVPVVSELTGVEVLLKSVGRKVNRAELNMLVGNETGRSRRAESMHDPIVLARVAILYESELPIGERSRVEYVRSQLATYGIHKSASWVQQVAQLPRDEGILKTGRRSTKKQRTKK